MSQDVKTMYNVKLEIGTSFAAQTSTWTYSELRNGIENLSEAMNYVINKYQFFSEEGWGSTHITGAHNEITLTGRRIMGDAAQDYIFSKKDKFDRERETSMKITVTDSSGASPIQKVWTQDVVIADMQEWNGATTDDSAISIVLSCNGKPTITTTTPNGGGSGSSGGSGGAA